jgi:lipopolysaccharide export system protein LptA
MRKLITLAAALVLLAAAAQEGDDRRIIVIETDGGTVSGNIRFGPIRYEHPDPDGVRATVSNLMIFAQNATLQVPEELGEMLLADAQGQRQAAFEGGVRVERGRLEANGPELVYSEATGLGVIDGGAIIVIAPGEEGDDPTDVSAETVEFDVDTDRSVSRGGVLLVSGNQTARADELTFAEDQDLGRLVNLETVGQPSITRLDDDGDELLITADEIRVLTETQQLYAIGNVTVVDGTITSTGDTVFFDDDLNIAEVIGSPAVSVDDSNGFRLEADRIQQDIEFDVVEAIDASLPSEFSDTPFVFLEEAGGASDDGENP